jgi:nucleotide-binding universal stress UspA family protein
MTTRVTAWFERLESSADAVHWAAAEAALRHAALDVVACYDLPLGIDFAEAWMPELLRSLEASVRTATDALVDDIERAHPQLDVHAEVCRDPSLESFRDHAPDGLCVLAAPRRHAWSPIARVLDELLDSCACPLVVLPPGGDGRGDVAAVTRIVVGVDGSPAADRALAWAALEADLRAVPLLLVHCWTFPYLGMDTHGSQVRDLLRVDAACVLDRAAETARERAGAPVAHLLLERGPVTGLGSVTEAGDLLVVGRHGAGGAQGRPGSMTAGLLAQLTAPLVVVP